MTRTFAILGQVGRCVRTFTSGRAERRDDGVHHTFDFVLYVTRPKSKNAKTTLYEFGVAHSIMLGLAHAGMMHAVDFNNQL